MADPATFIASWITPSSLFIFVNLIIGMVAITSRFTPKNHDHHHHHLVRSPSLLQRVRSFNLTHYYSHHDQECTQPQLVPTPSVLERLSSFNLSFHKHESTHAQTQSVQSEHSETKTPELIPTPSLLERLTSFNLSLQEQESTDAQTQGVQPEHSEPKTPELIQTPSLLEPLTSFNLSQHKQEPTHAQTQQVQAEPEHEQPELVRSPSLLQRLQSINLSRLYRSESTHGQDPDLGDPGRGSGKAEMRKSASERGGRIEREEEDEVERRRPKTARAETTSCKEDEEVDAKADDFINRFKKQLRLQRIDSLLRYRAGNC
ncbi:unnamed protein product [Sphenostylis stenocarpa]|uniref:DUF4408 domain-containing protein n=1 Tax=Sphenostylis stenocarpa TaxID=92480 RepID=A0AA86S4B6_9FABA|nr:unnamed protein product [Sphenostylis stenocarpa]